MANPALADDPATQFGPLLRRYRSAAGLTQRVLADLSTVSVRAIRDLEQGKAQPRPDTVRLLTGALRLGRDASDDLKLAAGGRAGRTLREEYGPHIAVPPTVLTPMFGRDAELGAIIGELASDNGRLVTLHGLPGVGRTRLAVAVAADLHSAGTPVLWVSAPHAYGALTQPVRDIRLAALLTTAVAALFGAGTTALAGLIGERDTLLVVDDVNAANLHVDALLGLLGDCPRLRVLVTADGQCGLPGERPFLLAPLPVPATVEPRLLAEEPAVRLFVHHVTAARQRLSAADAPDIAELCLLTDGLPPALAAAASWLEVFDLPTLREVLAADPGALVDADLMGRLAARVAALAPADRAALAGLTGPARTLAEVATSTGRTVAAAGGLVRDLVQRGLIRARHVAGRSRFAVPVLVGALLRGEHRMTAPARIEVEQPRRPPLAVAVVPSDGPRAALTTVTT
ncbi:MAG TPA: helix-turn-helix domain-containing protein [Actinophytocola sp.]|jgi:transcriptional regulator with XRE-family HTH domain|uniref:helix-turn-helix domain-containing protein n=1 Tax=Actinophytocola sp. TaxID=1872138 RepID=UPI002F92827C